MGARCGGGCAFVERVVGEMMLTIREATMAMRDTDGRARGWWGICWAGSQGGGQDKHSKYVKCNANIESA